MSRINQQPILHFVEVDAIRMGHRVRALCGAMVDHTQHSSDPLCPECLRRLSEDAASIAELEHTEPVGK